MYFITTGDGGAINGIDVQPLRDFIGLEGCDDSVKQVLARVLLVATVAPIGFELVM